MLGTGDTVLPDMGPQIFGSIVEFLGSIVLKSGKYIPRPWEVCILHRILKISYTYEWI